MKRFQQWLVVLLALLLMAGTAGALTWLKVNQKLGRPGVKATPLPGTIRMQVDLPDKVLNFDSSNVPESEVVLGYLPKDTIFAERFYHAPDGFSATATVVLMGADRTSIHRPDYCLPGQGWRIDSKTEVRLRIGEGAAAYEMPVMKWIIHNTVPTPDGGQQDVSGLYVFWFVADNQQTTDNVQRMWWLARDLMRSGVLQRWAYISYFTVCAPGQEDTAFERIKSLITASVPAYQLPPHSRVAR